MSVYAYLKSLFFVGGIQPSGLPHILTRSSVDKLDFRSTDTQIYYKVINAYNNNQNKGNNLISGHVSDIETIDEYV
jgi:hypothetical protein